MKTKTKATARLAGKTAVALAAAGVAAALALRAGGIWTPARTTLITLIGASAVLSAGTAIAAALGEWLKQRDPYRRGSAAAVLEATAWAIVDATGIDFRDLGLAAYVEKRRRWARWDKRLHRVHRVRAKFRPVSSKVDWRPGAGVIGTCVKKGQVVSQDLAADYAAVWPCSRGEWDQDVDEEIKHGLSYEEFLDVREKYEVVIATPILDDAGARTKTIGCIALDGPAGSFDRLQELDVLGLLDSAGRTWLRAMQDRS